MSYIPASFSAAYVGILYLFPSTRVNHDLTRGAIRDRNHATVLKSRLLAVSFISITSLAILPLALSRIDPSFTNLNSVAQYKLALQLAGLQLPHTFTCAGNLLFWPTALTVSLFSGSIWVAALGKSLPGQIGFSWRRARQNFSSWDSIRSLFVAPLTEEIVFRSCVIASSALLGMNKRQLIFLTPLYFGFAHMHHAYETYLAGGKTILALKRAVLQSTFQLTYTMLFGWYSSFLFLRTGSIIPPLIAHVFCNLMGFPPLDWALQVYPDRKLSLFGTYAAGIGLFIYGFWKWTDPVLFGGSIYWTL